METAKDKICPMSGNLCMQDQCAWWSDFANYCSVPLLAGMFADSSICRTVFLVPTNREPVEYETVPLR